MVIRNSTVNSVYNHKPNYQSPSLTYSEEVVGDLEVVALIGQLALHLGVGVVNDGQEHVDQYEEDEEDEQHEECGAQVGVYFSERVEIKTAKDYVKQGKTVTQKKHCLRFKLPVMNR